MKWVLLLIGALLLASPGWAADGESCDDHDSGTVDTGTNKGTWTSQCIMLCDQKTSTGECGQIDLASGGLGIPDQIRFLMVSSDSCTAPAVDIQHSVDDTDNTPGGTDFDIITLDSTVRGHTHTLPPMRYIRANVTNATSCNATGSNNGLSVWMVLNFESKGD